MLVAILLVIIKSNILIEHKGYCILRLTKEQARLYTSVNRYCICMNLRHIIIVEEWVS